MNIPSDTHLVRIDDDLSNCKFLIRQIVKALSNSPTKNRKRSMIINKLAEAVLWIEEAEKGE